MFDKEYFLNQLRNGAKLDDMGHALADAMNAANETYLAEQAIAAQAAQDLINRKYAIAEEMIDLIKEYGELVAPEACDIMEEYDQEDLDIMIKTLDDMFNMVCTLHQLKTQLGTTPAAKAPMSDDDALANFLRTLM